AFRLNLYGEAASQLTPNRLGGEPARFLGLAEARLRPVTALVAIGVEVAAEGPVFVIAAAALIAYYVPDWRDAARIWLHRHLEPRGAEIHHEVLVDLPHPHHGARREHVEHELLRGPRLETGRSGEDLGPDPRRDDHVAPERGASTRVGGDRDRGGPDLPAVFQGADRVGGATARHDSHADVLRPHAALPDGGRGGICS